MPSTLQLASPAADLPLTEQVQQLVDQTQISSETENRMMRALMIATAKMGMMGEDLEAELLEVQHCLARYKDLTHQLKQLVVPA
ncbi:MAG: hypothetical protein AAF399_11245 [Bacteroidota bacterium]